MPRPGGLGLGQSFDQRLSTAGRPGSVQGGAGAASLSLSLITCTQTVRAVNATATVTLTAYDAANNRITTGGETVVFACTGGTFGATTDVGDGTYTAIFTAATAAFAAANITATIGGSAVTSAKPTMRVYTMPAITSLTPATGYLGGGTLVAVVGTNIASDATVDVGGSAATSVTPISATSLTFITPAGTEGAQTVTLSNTALSDTDTFTYHDALFASDWATAEGTGSAAIRDGTKWHSDVYNPSGYLEVVPAATAGINDDWPTANALRVTRSSSKTARAWTSVDNGWSAPANGQTLYFRMFLRMEAPTATATENSNHPVEAVYVATGGSDSSSKYTWKFAPSSSTEFDLAFWVDNVPNPSHYAFKLLTAAGARTHLTQGETYRLEWSLTNGGADTYTVHLRVYDNANALVGSGASADWRSAFSPYPKVEATPYTVLDTRVVDLRVGNNGATWTNTDDEYYYLGGFMVRDDDWCGPY